MPPGLNSTHRTRAARLLAPPTDAGDFPLLLAAALVMVIVVVSFNRTLWQRLYRLAETRFKLEI